MTQDSELEVLYQEVVRIADSPEGRVYGTGLWKKCHQLAKRQYEPAKELFIKLLDDPRWGWRRVSVSLLGFHYQLDQNIIEQFRRMLISDADSGVRIACASVLGSHSYLGDPVLVKALENDDNKFVREAAFFSILDLGKIPYKKRKMVVDKIRSGDIEPTIHEVRQIFAEENLHF